MACNRTLDGWQLADGSITFKLRAGMDVKRALTLPCGQCTGCRLERSRGWAVRAMCEAQLHGSQNAFVTLTYSDPAPLSLDYRHYQSFLKRLRARSRVRIRFIAVGEYGEQTLRPHFHALLFGFDFPDKVYFKKSVEGNLYTSAMLTETWGRGHCLTGAVTFESAAYVARYCMKKINGEAAEQHYTRVDQYGEVHQVEPEMLRCSLKPGIGAEWVNRYLGDVKHDGKIVSRGQLVNVPRYFRKLIQELDGEAWENIEYLRERDAYKFAADRTRAREDVKETVAKARVAFYKRGN